MKDNIVSEDIKKIAKSIKNDVKKLAGKSLLISGGAGFIGSYILATMQYLNENILSRKCFVISIDNYITGSPRGLIPIKSDKYITHKKHNIIKPFKTKEKIDYIIHAAGIASPIYYRQSPLETIDVTIQGVRNLLNLAKEKKVKSFLYFSSSEIYGDPHKQFLPTPETYRGHVSSIGERSVYDESKRLGETICMVYHNLYKVPIKMVRPFNVYGPGMKPTDYRVLPMFISKGFQGEPLPIHSHGNQTRTFCYISDAVTAFFKVFLSERNGEVYNVGNDDCEIKMVDLAKKVAKYIGGNVKIIKIPYPKNYPQDEPQRRYPDLTKIKKHLKYSPAVDLDAGLQRFISWYRQTYSV
ncbi:MAG: NAD-dependent epimerase/dehydratase family protein [Candidatus Levybacteria bacterium]|nr:NAD-dependent epimerase/dehydratase family protein [Candidatus Levybacteria bacterium]